MENELDRLIREDVCTGSTLTPDRWGKLVRDAEEHWRLLPWHMKLRHYPGIFWVRVRQFFGCEPIR